MKSTFLAINGGRPILDSKSIKQWPIITREDKKAVIDVLNKGILWGENAPKTKELEKVWADYVGVKYCLAVNSGTAALHMAVAAAGVGPGEEVITSPFTFLASASAILHHNAIPIFADIDPKTYIISPESIEKNITSKTKAIIPVHIAGLPCDMDSIMRIAKKYKLIVIEDACQAHGATYKGKKVGSIGHMAAFSLNATKNLSGGEGGLFVTNYEKYYKKASMVRMFGEPPTEKGKKREYNAYGMGWMYRTQEMAAALTLSQLKRLDRYNAIRIENSEYLTKNFSNIEEIVTPFVPSDRTHVYHFYIIRFKQKDYKLSPKLFREKVEIALRAEGVNISQWQTMPVPAQTLFRVKEGYGKGCPWSCHFYNKKITYNLNDLPETTKFINGYTVIHGINPPNGIKLMKLYVKAFKKVFNNI